MTTRTWDNSYKPTLAEFKAHIRLTMTSVEMDASLELQLKAAIRSAEHYIGQIIARSSFVLNSTFAKAVTLQSPVVSVEEVTVAGVTIADNKYKLKDNVLLLDVEASDTDALEVKYTAGMDGVDEDIKAAILLHAAALFANPVDSVETLPKASSRLLDPYRSWGMHHAK
jgi:mannose/fructose/N-acetylgalactosamine-specific phosphotransferase system component IIB